MNKSSGSEMKNSPNQFCSVRLLKENKGDGNLMLPDQENPANVE